MNEPEASSYENDPTHNYVDEVLLEIARSLGVLKPPFSADWVEEIKFAHVGSYAEFSSNEVAVCILFLRRGYEQVFGFRYPLFSKDVRPEQVMDFYRPSIPASWILDDFTEGVASTFTETGDTSMGIVWVANDEEVNPERY